MSRLIFFNVFFSFFPHSNLSTVLARGKRIGEFNLLFIIISERRCHLVIIFTTEKYDDWQGCERERPQLNSRHFFVGTDEDARTISELPSTEI